MYPTDQTTRATEGRLGGFCTGDSSPQFWFFQSPNYNGRMMRPRTTMPATEFLSWKQGFCQHTRVKNLPLDVIQHFLDIVKTNETVLKSRHSQTEIDLPAGRYVQRLLTDSRIEAGRIAMARHLISLQRAEEKFGVDTHILVAIWGIETRFGNVMGEISTLDALSTLAAVGSDLRQKFWQNELIAALQMISSDHCPPAKLVGSWAGAMGHTQFMPSSYLSDAVSLIGEGSADIWGDDPADSLASTANFLRRRGWQSKLPWGDIAVLPDRFDYLLSGHWNSLSASRWKEIGVTLRNGRSFKDWGECSLISPGGHRGMAFLVTRNFFVLLRYNTAIPYAVAVGLLSNELKGKRSDMLDWPNAEKKLSQNNIRNLQQMLVQRGFNTNGIDGLLGPATHRAVQRVQAEMGEIPDGLPSQKFLDMLSTETK